MNAYDRDIRSVRTRCKIVESSNKTMYFPIVLLVDGQCNLVDEVQLQRWDVSPVLVHGDLGLVAHGLLHVALGEELGVHQFLF